jgi:hypothetical protein
LALGSFCRRGLSSILHQEVEGSFAAVYPDIHPPTQAQASGAVPAVCHTVAVWRNVGHRAAHHRAPASNSKVCCLHLPVRPQGLPVVVNIGVWPFGVHSLKRPSMP